MRNGSALIYLLLDITIGLRPKHESERVGLDLTEHGERAYNDA
jgi:Amt family ammonium transporter